MIYKVRNLGDIGGASRAKPGSTPLNSDVGFTLDFDFASTILWLTPTDVASGRPGASHRCTLPLNENLKAMLRKHEGHFAFMDSVPGREASTLRYERTVVQTTHVLRADFHRSKCGFAPKAEFEFDGD
jgi:hypothetical protein